MNGWTGHFLRVNLTAKTFKKESFSEDFARKWIGGRGFAVKILFDELAPGIDPLGPDNKFIVALGPIAGIPAPNTGKAVVAGKSPSTGGYGDGNLGTRVAEQLRKAGYDALIVEGRASGPTMLYIEDDKVEFLPADEVWGKGTYETNDWIYAKYGKGVGVLNIGQAGENMVRYAVVRSLEGRAGGRTGMGAVMGSKLLKAVVVKGTKPIPQADPAGMKKVGIDDLREVNRIDKKTGWSIQSTNGVLAWCNEVAALPVRNFRKTHHPDAWKVDGERLNNARIATYGCPNCTMRCGITIHDDEGRESELDYENVGLLGPNLEIFDLAQLGSLNYLCDDYGIDTMSGGCVLSFYADAIDHGAVTGDYGFNDRRGFEEAAGRDRPAGDGDRQPPGRGLHAGRAQVRPRLDRLRHAGQGPRSRGLQLQVHPGHGPGLRRQPDRRPPQGIVGHHLRAQADRRANPTARRRPRRSSSSRGSGAACSSTSSPAASPGSRTAGASRTTPSISSSSAVSTGPWTTSGRSRTGSTP